MQDGIWVAKPSTWDSAVLLARALSLADKEFRWGFRGVSSETQELQPSLERISKDHDTFSGNILKREYRLLTEFKRRAHHYISNPPPLKEELEWLALLQHHGGPTRILDFTWSFYVAMFFAVYHTKNALNLRKNAAIWIVNTRKLRKNVSSRTGIPIKAYAFDTIQKQHHKLANESLYPKVSKNGPPDPLVVLVEPFRKNERLTIQQGFFLFPRDLRTDFQANLAATFDLPSISLSHQAISQEVPELFTATTLSEAKEALPKGIAVAKIIISPECQVTAISDLKRMNITEASLFPGLDGFARSLVLRLWPKELENL
ncbi:MAG TPA: FRG domain-containing protein [Chloroflexia bacterium]|jgi:hypothetical protein